MSPLVREPLTAVVDVAAGLFEGAAGQDLAYAPVLRPLKAAALYADTVEVTQLTFGVHFMQRFVPPELKPRSGIVWVNQAIRAWRDADAPAPAQSGGSRSGKLARTVFAELRLALEAGALVVPEVVDPARGPLPPVERPSLSDVDDRRAVLKSALDESIQLFAERGLGLWGDPSVVPVIDQPLVSFLRMHPDRRQWEGVIATSLLGQLEAFPDASMDVLLDVRARLADSRAHFRAGTLSVPAVSPSA